MLKSNKNRYLLSKGEETPLRARPEGSRKGSTPAFGRQAEQIRAFRPGSRRIDFTTLENWPLFLLHPSLFIDGGKDHHPDNEKEEDRKDT